MLITACEIPKNCEQIQDMGLDETGEYYIIPSGSLQDDVKHVMLLGSYILISKFVNLFRYIACFKMIPTLKDIGRPF